MSLQYATRITARERGDFLVERLCQNVVVDRYTTGDLRAPRRNREPWVRQAGEWCSALPSPAPLPPAAQPHWVFWAEYVSTENQYGESVGLPGLGPNPPPAEPGAPVPDLGLQPSAEALA